MREKTSIMLKFNLSFDNDTDMESLTKEIGLMPTAKK